MPPDSINRRPFQFGVIDLLALVTVIAIVLGWVPTCFQTPPFAIVNYVAIGVGQVILARQVRRKYRRPPLSKSADDALPDDLGVGMAYFSLPAWCLTLVVLVLNEISEWPFRARNLGEAWEHVTIIVVSTTACFQLIVCLTWPASLLGLLMMYEWTKHWKLTLLLLLNIAHPVCLVAIVYHQLIVNFD